MPADRIRIVHISDLHLGKETTQRWRMRPVLGSAWADNLRAIAQDGPVHLLCFTGDVAQSGKAEQYEEAQEFVHAALEILQLRPDRFFCVPGNHDVDRDINSGAWQSLREALGNADRGAADGVSRWMAGGRAPFGFQADWRDAVLARQAAYQRWLSQIGRDALRPQEGLLGWRVSLDVGWAAPLHLVGLDSAWLAGDKHDATQLLLTTDQIGRLCTDEEGAQLKGPIAALMHHPFDELADGREGRRLLAEHGVSLVLHGHLHEAEHARWNTPSQGLHLSAAGCLYESTNFPNSLQVLDLAPGPNHTLQPHQLWARAWSPRGHWHDDNGLYDGMSNGRWIFQAPPAPAQPLSSDEFVGREDQLDQLKAALLSQPGQEAQAVVVCCAIEGMPGVGKTRLAEEFVAQHWLPHWGLTLEDGMAHHVVRLALSPEAKAPSTQDLAQTVADRLRLTGPQDTLFTRVSEGLRHGPGGKPRLLWLDNIDTPALAAAVAPLSHHLKGCPLLVTARFQRLCTHGWQRVPVKPMDDTQALQLLHSQLEDHGQSLTPQEAQTLVQRLGGLPLALHIAASHLNLGHTPRSFIQALEVDGLGLPPADAADPALLANHARAIIRHSFELSWRHWCGTRSPEWQQALLALAHGPASDLGPSLAAALSGLGDDEWAQLAPQATRLSLLQMEASSRRFSLHPLIAEFLRGQAGSDASAVRQRLSEWFMPRLPETGDAAQGQAWGEVWAEPAALHDWLQGLAPIERLRVARAASMLAVHQGPFGLWYGFLERLIRQVSQPDDLSDLYWILCRVAQHIGNIDLALSYATEKGCIDQRRGDDPGYASAQALAADILQALGRFDEALKIRKEQVLPICERLGDERGRAVTMGKIADIYTTRGEIDDAMRIRHDELQVFERLGDARETAVTKGKIANILKARGQLDDAERLIVREVIPVFERLGDVCEKAFALSKLAEILQVRGYFDRAQRIYEEDVLPVFDRVGDVRSSAFTQAKIAGLHKIGGRFDEAKRVLQTEVLPVFERLHDVHWKAIVWRQLADILHALGELDPALSILQADALPVFERLGDVRNRATALGKVANIWRTRGELNEALRICREDELPLYERLGDQRSIAICKVNMALILEARCDASDAADIERLLREAHASAVQMGLHEAAAIEGTIQRVFGRPLTPA